VELLQHILRRNQVPEMHRVETAAQEPDSSCAQAGPATTARLGNRRGIPHAMPHMKSALADPNACFPAGPSWPGRPVRMKIGFLGGSFDPCIRD